MTHMAAGAESLLTFVPVSRTWGPSSALVMVAVPCEVLEWSHNSIACTVRVRVRVRVFLAWTRP